MAYVAPSQDPFRAIADPGRRRMLDALLEQEHSVKELTVMLGISQPAVSQHLQVMKLAGLVQERAKGRNTLYSARPAELRVVVDWLSKYQAFWSNKLDALEAHLARTASNP
jgi:DNA-binding transcriptional ArsR family regulator